MPFFSWKDLHKKYPQYKKCGLQVILAPRNCGKSYATYHEKIIKQNLLQPNAKVLFLRNTDKELAKMKADFNARFRGKYMTKGDFIYTVRRETLINKRTKKETEVEKCGELVGYFASINAYTNYKSMEAKDIKLIFYEEFNEDTSFGKNIYFKFINLVKTFQRFSDLQIVMLGNKDAYKTDFHINWDIIPEDSIDNDIISEIKTEDGDLVGVWYDLSPRNYDDLNNQATLADKLATFDGRTDVYAKGGYRDPISEIVINYKKIRPDFIQKYNLSVDDQTFAFGQIEGTDYWALISPWNFKDLSYPNYAVDVKSNLVKDALLLDEEESIDIGEFVFSLMKAQKLIFDSYDTYDLFRTNMMFLKIGRLGA